MIIKMTQKNTLIITIMLIIIIEGLSQIGDDISSSYLKIGYEGFF